MWLNPDLSKASFANNFKIVKIGWLHPGQQKVKLLQRHFLLFLTVYTSFLITMTNKTTCNPLVSPLYTCCRRKCLTVGTLCSLSSGRKKVRIRGVWFSFCCMSTHILSFLLYSPLQPPLYSLFAACCHSAGFSQGLVFIYVRENTWSCI